VKFFDHPSAVAFTSDASIDFTPPDFDSPLTDAQQAYLKARTGKEIPQVFWRKQVHEDTVITAQGKPSDCRACPDADAFITNQKGIPIAIRTADCLPVFIYDPVKGAAGLAHAGWKGTRSRIAAKTVKTMQDKFGCQCYDLHIALGPSLRRCCYEVGAEFKEYFPQDVSLANGRLHFDIIAANIRQLTDAGVPAENIFDSRACTFCQPGHFSFRRDGEKSGRMISLMML